MHINTAGTSTIRTLVVIVVLTIGQPCSMVKFIRWLLRGELWPYIELVNRGLLVQRIERKLDLVFLKTKTQQTKKLALETILAR